MEAKEHQRLKGLADRVIQNSPPKIPVASNASSNEHVGLLAIDSLDSNRHKGRERKNNRKPDDLNLRYGDSLDCMVLDVNSSAGNDSYQDLRSFSKENKASTAMEISKIQAQSKVVEALDKMLQTKVKERAKHMRQSPLDVLQTRKDVVTSLSKIGKYHADKGRRTSLRGSLPAKFQKLNQRIESELGILGTASAMACAMKKEPHPPSENKKLKKQSNNIVKKMEKKLNQYNKIKSSLFKNQAHIEEKSSESDSYRQWKKYSLNAY